MYSSIARDQISIAMRTSCMYIRDDGICLKRLIALGHHLLYDVPTINDTQHFKCRVLTTVQMNLFHGGLMLALEDCLSSLADVERKLFPSPPES